MTLCAYEALGEGRTVLFLHSFPFDRSMWRAELAVAAGASRRGISLDLPGFGESGLDALSQQYPPNAPSLRAYVNATIAIMDAHRTERATVVGLSLGGYVALAIARDHPERIEGLVLADTRATVDTPPVKAGRVINQALVRSRGSLALIDKLLPGLVSASATEPLRAQLRAMAARQPPEGLSYALLAMRDRQDSTPILSAIRAPTLVLVGEHDAITPPAEMRAMASQIGGARFAEIPGVGHLSSLEAPLAFGALLRDFLLAT